MHEGLMGMFDASITSKIIQLIDTVMADGSALVAKD